MILKWNLNFIKNIYFLTFFVNFCIIWKMTVFSPIISLEKYFV